MALYKAISQVEGFLKNEVPKLVDELETLEKFSGEQKFEKLIKTIDKTKEALFVVQTLGLPRSLFIFIVRGIVQVYLNKKKKKLDKKK